MYASREEIEARLTAIASQIDSDYAGRTIDFVVCLNGASIFGADLVRRISLPSRIHHLGFSPSQNGSQSGEVRITYDIAEPLYGKHVILLDGIVVSGRTPLYIKEALELRRPASVSLCVLGVKKRQLAVNLKTDYWAFEIDQETVVGYGIGSDTEKTLPYLGVRHTEADK